MVISAFNNKQPLILTVVDGSLVPPKRDHAGAKFHSVYLAKCYEPEELITGIGARKTEYRFTQSCNDIEGNFFMFSFNDLTGTCSSIIGSALPPGSDYKDYLVVAPFVCDEMG